MYLIRCSTQKGSTFTFFRERSARCPRSSSTPEAPTAKGRIVTSLPVSYTSSDKNSKPFFKLKCHSSSVLIGHLYRHSSGSCTRMSPGLLPSSFGIFRTLTDFVLLTLVPARSAEQLKAYLQSQQEYRDVTLQELTDGWDSTDCISALEGLEKKHEILIFRHNGKIINVFDDDPTLHTNINEDMKSAWKEIALPATSDELRTALEKAGLKPTTAPRQISRPVQQAEKKRKPPRRGGRQTNSHLMQGLLKDYSHIRNLPK